MKNKILAISTCDPEKTAILLAEFSTDTSSSTLRKCGIRSVVITDKKVWRAETHQSEELLPEIDKLLKKNKVLPKNLGLIIVNIGPGSFTGTRVGVATANALVFGLEIPVAGVKNKGKIEDILKVGFKLFQEGRIKEGIIAKPFYDQAPNITKSKRM